MEFFMKQAILFYFDDHEVNHFHGFQDKTSFFAQSFCHEGCSDT